MKDSKFLRFVISHRLLTGLVIFVILTVLAVGIPHFVGDGTDRFVGVKKEVAEEALQNAYATQDPMSRAVNVLAFQFYVEDIYRMQPEDAKKYCKLSQDDDGTGYYSIEMSQVTIFGFRGDRASLSLLNDCAISKRI